MKAESQPQDVQADSQQRNAPRFEAQHDSYSAAATARLLRQDLYPGVGLPIAPLPLLPSALLT